MSTAASFRNLYSTQAESGGIRHGEEEADAGACHTAKRDGNALPEGQEAGEDGNAGCHDAQDPEGLVDGLHSMPAVRGCS